MMQQPVIVMSEYPLSSHYAKEEEALDKLANMTFDGNLLHDVSSSNIVLSSSNEEVSDVVIILGLGVVFGQ
jgi:hypothetical protein